MMTDTHLYSERQAILTVALPHAPFDGWTQKLLNDATIAAGYEATMGLRAFPGGILDLLYFYIEEADRKMVAAFEAQDVSKLKIREKVALAIRLRLEHEIAHREAIRRGLQILAAPQNAPRAMKSLYHTVDAIWYALGDKSTDFNFYTKRMLLAGVYSATLLVWLEDKSPGFEETWGFLDRRIADVMKIQSLRGRLENLTEHLPNPFRLFARRS